MATESSHGRILTTHTGSLPRPPDLAAMLAGAAGGNEPDPDLLAKATAAAVGDAVLRQADAGVDYASDGEQGQVSFMATRGRLTGFDGPKAPYFPRDLAVDGLQPGFAAFFMANGDRILSSNTTRDIAYVPGFASETVRHLTDALAARPSITGGFLAAPSPGVLARLGTTAFAGREEFMFAIATAMRAEYREITGAGLQVQLDDPTLAMGHHVDYPDASVQQFRDLIRANVRALNWGLDGIPPEMTRLHLCWGNYPGPHHWDFPLEHLIDILYQANVGTLCIPLASPRHRHEWRVFQEHPLPDHMVLAAGMIDPTSPTVEHPQAVADDLIRLAGVVGRDRLVAGTDCGFATFAGIPEAPAEVAFLKLAALAEGARIASGHLWP